MKCSCLFGNSKTKTITSMRVVFCILRLRNYHIQMAALLRLCDPTFRLSATGATQSGADGDVDRRSCRQSQEFQTVQHFPRAPVGIFVILRDGIRRGKLRVEHMGMGLCHKTNQEILLNAVFAAQESFPCETHSCPLCSSHYSLKNSSIEKGIVSSSKRNPVQT